MTDSLRGVERQHLAHKAMIDRIMWMLLSVLPSVFELSWTPVSAHFL